MSLKYIFFIESHIIFVDNFLKNKNRYIIWRRWFYENFPGEILTQETPTRQTPPRKIATQKILTWNIPTHFI